MGTKPPSITVMPQVADVTGLHVLCYINVIIATGTPSQDFASELLAHRCRHLQSRGSTIGLRTLEDSKTNYKRGEKRVKNQTGLLSSHTII